MSLVEWVRGRRVGQITEEFHSFMVIREQVGSDTHGRVEVSIDYASGLSVSGRRPRMLSGRTEVGGKSYKADRLLVVTIVSKPDEGEISFTEDIMTYLVGTDGRVFLVVTQDKKSLELPDQAAKERKIFLNEGRIQANPVSNIEADHVITLAQLATKAARESRR